MQQARRKDAKSSINRLMVLVEFYFTVIKSIYYIQIWKKYLPN